MSRRLHAFAAVVSAIAFALAGCTGSSGPTFTIPDDADATAEQEGVEDPHILVVHVEEAGSGGEAVWPTGVVFFTNATNASDAEGSQADADGDVRVEDAAGEVSALAGGRTNQTGTVTGYLAPNTIVHVAVGGAEGYTNEVQWDVQLGPAGERTEITVPLYRQALAFNETGTMPPSASTAGATMGATDPATDAIDLPFAEDAQADQGYRARLVSMEVILSWENGPDGYGDLYAGWGVDDEVLVEGEDERQTPTDEENTERVEVDRERIAEHREALASAEQVQGFAITDDAAVSVDGLEYAILAEARFEGTGHGITIRV